MTTETIRTAREGDVVIATNVPHVEELNGQKVTITEVGIRPNGQTIYYANFDRGSNHTASYYFTDYRWPDDSDTTPTVEHVDYSALIGKTVYVLDAHMYTEYVSTYGVVESQNEGDLMVKVRSFRPWEDHQTIRVSRWETKDGEVSELTGQEAYTQALDKHLRSLIAKANRAFDYAGETAAAIANDQGYCSEYDNVVEELNSRLSNAGYEDYQFPPREQEFELEGYFAVNMRVPFRVTVTATSEEEAWDMFTDDPSAHTDPDDIITNYGLLYTVES